VTKNGGKLLEMLLNGEDKMDPMDAHNLERNKNLARQMESLRGLRFFRKESDDQYTVLSTSVEFNGDVYVAGVCRKARTPGDFLIGRVFWFHINEICFDLDAIETLEARVSQEHSA